MRGSVDAGQPDPNQINSLLSLVAAKERKNSTPGNNSDSRNSQHAEGEKNGTESGKGDLNMVKANINVTTNPLDISLCAGKTPPCAQGSTGSRSRGRTTGNYLLIFVVN